MLKYIVATLLILPTVIGGSYFLAVAQDTTPPPTPKWHRVAPTEEAGLACAEHGEKAKLVTIYNWTFEFEEARCYPQGGVD